MAKRTSESSVPPDHSTFAAIDFETADYEPDSACAVGVVRVERGTIVARDALLIRPPRRQFVFTYVHGITWSMVADSPTFANAWKRIAPMLDGVDTLVAHNASFDKKVLNACCNSAGLAAPALPFLCTVQLARRRFGFYPTKLPDVCRQLGIQLKHHDAASDAEACARIVIAAQEAAKATQREPAATQRARS